MIIIARKGNIHKVMQFLEAEMVSGHMFIKGVSKKTQHKQK